MRCAVREALSPHRLEALDTYATSKVEVSLSPKVQGLAAEGLFVSRFARWESAVAPSPAKRRLGL